MALEDRAGRFLPFLARSPWQDIPITCLLAHSSGLPAWRPLGLELCKTRGPAIAGTIDARDAVADRIRNQTPLAACGTGAVYSDLGYILLGWILEVAAGERLDRLFDRFVASPLGLERTFFVPVSRGVPGPLPVRPDEVAATEMCPTRGRILSGEVHDDNAWILGGVAGHAGLFGTAGDVLVIVQALRDAAAGLPSPFPGDIVRRFLTREASPADSSRVLAFDTPSQVGSMAGAMSPAGTVGHLGFTGTSFWFHPGCGAAIVLLTNRVHPSRDNEGARIFRPALHDMLWPVLC
jgi:CubicO group peptidase (beta-lactamase class C family)